MISKINNTTIKAKPIPVPPILTPPLAHKLDTIIYPLLHYVNPNLWSGQTYKKIENPCLSNRFEPYEKSVCT